MKLSVIKHIKLTIYVFVILLIGSGCLTVNKIQRNCEKFAQICTTPVKTVTEYRDTTIYRNDTVFLQLQADTVTITDTLRIINNKAFLSPVNKEIGLIGVTAWANFNILNVRAWLRDSTILIPHRDTIFIDNAIRTNSTISTLTITKKYIPGFYRFTFWLFIISGIAGLLIIAWKILKFKFKLFKLK